MNELYEYASRYTPCKKGCSDCCHYAVTVSEVEIAFIEKFTRVKRQKTFSSKADFHGTPCPFLKNGSCSIYDVRPFVCRRHVTLTSTNTWCNPNISNNETFPLLRFTSLDEAFDDIRRESKSFEFYDIRQVFK
ncbi:YkgJ family cysteine cluster protein [Neptuniibacter marinus]|uniref:YkgJ family cysteine cluster protein n=1 Tax=Neptuniibacter marinus TaxID=1806670 RepID=UPI0009471A08